VIFISRRKLTSVTSYGKVILYRHAFHCYLTGIQQLPIPTATALFNCLLFKMLALVSDSVLVMFTLADNGLSKEAVWLVA